MSGATVKAVRLVDLDPRFFGHGGEGVRDRDGNPVPWRGGLGISCLCPCGCGERMALEFSNPIDGGPPLPDARPRWERTGETFETLTLTPSIQRADPSPGACRWHGYLTAGEFRSC